MNSVADIPTPAVASDQPTASQHSTRWYFNPRILLWAHCGLTTYSALVFRFLGEGWHTGFARFLLESAVLYSCCAIYLPPIWLFIALYVSQTTNWALCRCRLAAALLTYVNVLGMLPLVQ
jgi:hypothetical protein